MVGQQILDLFIGVRIPTSELFFELDITQKNSYNEILLTRQVYF